jgi:ACS family tartrate transporter-like MFS transporter
MVLSGAHSDATGERIWHIALPLLAGAAAFAWSAMALHLPLTMLALSLAALGIYACNRHVLVAADHHPDRNGAAAGLALVNAVGNLGGLAGPAVIGVLKQENGDFMLALLFLAGALAAGACITLLFGRVARMGDTSPRVIQ